MGAPATPLEGVGVAVARDALGLADAPGEAEPEGAGEVTEGPVTACPAVESVTPGVSPGPQKASPSPAAGPTDAGSSAGTGDADGTGVATAWVPNTMVTLEVRVWPPVFWIAVLGIVTW